MGTTKIKMSNPYPYGQPQQAPGAAEEGTRGFMSGKNAKIAAAVVGAAAVAGGAYYMYNKKKKKVTKREIMPDGSTRDIVVEVDCDPNDPEGYFVDENGAPCQQPMQQPRQQPMQQPAYGSNASIPAGTYPPPQGMAQAPSSPYGNLPPVGSNPAMPPTF